MENRPIYSAEITEIIGTPPRWILRVGGGLLLLLLLLFLGLAATISIPEQSSMPLLIRGATQPYYLIRAADRWQPLVAGGQWVRQGQPLARSLLDSSKYLRAPFAGLLYYEDFTTPGPVGDTLGTLVPAHNTYRFSGKVATERAPVLRQLSALRIQVALDEHAESNLTLWGQLAYINPVARNGKVTYTGQLDSASSILISKRLAAITNVEGRLLITRDSRPILYRLLH